MFLPAQIDHLKSLGLIRSSPYEGLYHGLVDGAYQGLTDGTAPATANNPIPVSPNHPARELSQHSMTGDSKADTDDWTDTFQRPIWG